MLDIKGTVLINVALASANVLSIDTFMILISAAIYLVILNELSNFKLKSK